MMGHVGRPASAATARARAMSSADCTKLSATRSTPAARPKRRSASSLSVMPAGRQRHVRRVDPLVLTELAAIDHARHDRVAVDRLDSQLDRAVVQQQTVARLQRAGERRVGRRNQAGPADEIVRCRSRAGRPA